MSDHADRRRGRRGAGTNPRRGATNNHDPGRRDREPEREATPTPPPRPIILAKPPGRDVDSASAIKQVDNAIIMVKTREDSASRAGTASISPSEIYRIKTLQSPSPVPILQDGITPQLRLALPTPMSQSVTLLDDSLQWSDSGLEFLLDQTDYLVVGVLGLEGTGKSTILSMIAGCRPDELVFKPGHDQCTHQTIGIDMYVTSNRVIFLDAQPVLSASVLDMYNRTDRKYPGEYSTSENMSEIQSLQMTSFLYTVCNCVLVVQDWFVDTYLLKFLMTAEMLRPSVPSVGSESSPDQDEFLPHLVMVMNKCERSDFTSESVNAMTKIIEKYFEKSKLRFQGGVSMATGTFPNLTSKTVDGKVNLFLLPWMQEKTESDPLSVMLPEYKGHPGFGEMIRLLRNQIYQLPRQSFTNAPLTERNWFHYAARIWDTVRKSQLIADYSRLLP